MSGIASAYTPRVSPLITIPVTTPTLRLPACTVDKLLTPRALRLLDALHLTLSAHCVYFYLVLNYDNPAALARVSLSFKVRPQLP